MQSSEGKIGRVFILRLEDGDVVPGCIEAFAAEKHIKMAGVTLIGGIGEGQIVVGPRYSDAMPPDPMLLPLDGAHEVVGIGLLVPDAKGVPRLHIHAALGRSGQTKTGCLRMGVKTWLEKPTAIDAIEKDGYAEPDREAATDKLKGGPSPELNRYGAAINDGRGLLADYLSTFFLTLTNPMTILSFAAIFAGLGIANTGGSPIFALILVVGVFLGSGSWWLILSSATNLLRSRFMKSTGLRWVNWISGAIIFGFGILALTSVFTI